MPSAETKTLVFNQYQNLISTIYFFADLEGLIEKINGCKNNLEDSSTTKIGEDLTSGFLMSTISLFKNIENNNGTYRGKYSIKKFPECLTEHAMEIICIKQKKK